MSESSKKQLVTVLALLVLVVVIVGVFVTTKNKKTTKPSTATTTQKTNTTTPSTAATNTTNTTNTDTYNDGEYSATGHYMSPGGNETIKISVTLKDGTVTGTSAQSGANEEEGREYQAMFISGYKQEIVGKSIDSIKLSRVSGSSLTSQGFNEALAQIKLQAKS